MSRMPPKRSSTASYCCATERSSPCRRNPWDGRHEKVHQPGEGRKTKGSSRMQVKKAEEQEVQFQLFCVNSSVDDSNRESKDAIEHLRAILEYPDLDSSDATVFRQAISKLEGVVDVLAAVKEELGKTELSKIPEDPCRPAPWVWRPPPRRPRPETVTGQVKGKWVVQAWINYHYSAIQVDITRRQGGAQRRRCRRPERYPRGR